MLTFHDLMDVFEPLALGRMSVEEAGALLRAQGVDAPPERLALYADCSATDAIHTLPQILPASTRALQERISTEGTDALMRQHAQLHPPAGRLGTDRVPGWLSSLRGHAPAWVIELGALELSACLAERDELGERPARLDLVHSALLDWAEGEAGEPAPCEETAVLTWQGPEGKAVQAEVGALERLVVEAWPDLPSPAALAAIGWDEADAADARRELIEIGALPADH